MPDKEGALRPGDRVSEGPARQIGIRWPAGVDQLLDELVYRANDAGANSNRRELTAALVIGGSNLSGDDLLAALVHYRQVKVSDILPVATDRTSGSTARRARG